MSHVTDPPVPKPIPKLASVTNLPAADDDDCPKTAVFQPKSRVLGMPDPSLFERTEKGKAIDCVSNAHLVLSDDERWRGKIKYNEFSDAIEVREPPWRSEIRPSRADATWCDDYDSRLALWLCHEYAIRAKSSTVHEAVNVIARQHSYHPIREYLTSRVWDRKARVAYWLRDYLGAADDAYTSSVSTWWLIAACARIAQPGCQVDHLPIFEGPQGIGKSSATKALVPDATWYTDTPPKVGERDGLLALRGAWILELAELSALGKREVEAIKLFVSSRSDRYREPYGRRMVTVPRQIVMVGTTNVSRYFRDSTGNRRFHPVRCGVTRSCADVDGLATVRDQLWAEAWHLYSIGVPWHPSTEGERALTADEQSARQVLDMWDADVERYVAGRTEVLIRDILAYALEIPIDRRNERDAQRVGYILSGLGWRQNGQRRADGTLVKSWIKP